MYDIVIKNGSVIDGTGAVAYHSDIAISDGRIVRIARNITDESKKYIDASGLTVTPGFIDSHSHSDDAVFAFPDMIEKIEQGITTSIGGQCGITLAPTKKHIDNEVDGIDKVSGIKKDVCRTFGTMVNAAKEISLGSNIMSFVGHGAIRRAVIGYDNRKPTETEMEEMKALLREAMENGALGISFGLIYTPSCYADTEELIELAKVVKEYEGMISAHIRDEKFALASATEEFLSVIKAADVKAVFSHHKAMHKENWGKVNHTMRMLDEAANEGYDIYCDMYPYIASCTSLVATIIPKELRAMSNDKIAELASDPEMRKKIKDTYSEKFGNSLENILITRCRAHSEYEGLRINEVAALRGQEQFDAAFDLIRDSGGVVSICNFSMCEEDVEAVMRYERSMVCTDSTVASGSKVFHPRLKGTFPRVLGRYVRERKIVTLHEMIRKCTSLPASVYGLPSKGILREGFDADICIFDADRIIDRADFTDCDQRCEGLNYVILGGDIVVENAVYNGKRKGEFILRQR